MALQPIGRMQLKNSGGFVARIQFSYIDSAGDGDKHLSRQSGDITLGMSKNIAPDELGVPDGAMIYMHAFVVWGTDNEARKTFLFQKGNPHCANYNISGTTLNNDLGLIDIS